MKKREAKANTLLNQYLRVRKIHCYYELKNVKGSSFPFSKVEENQWEGMKALEKGGLVWKLSDEDSRKKPCDGFSLPPLPAFLILKWNDCFYFLRSFDVLSLKEKGKKKITFEECQEMAQIKVFLS